MTLTKQEIEETKSQLRNQVQNLSPEDKEKALKEIENLSEQAIEALIEQQRSKNSQKIFRMIIEGKIPSTKIGENPSAIAVLSVRSISEGHTIIIPKSPLSAEAEFPEEINKLSQEISNKLKSSLSAKSVKTLPQALFGEKILNLIPIYDSDLSLESPQTERSQEELQKIKSKLEVIKLEEKKKEKIKKVQKKSKPLKLNRRIP